MSKRNVLAVVCAAILAFAFLNHGMAVAQTNTEPDKTAPAEAKKDETPKADASKVEAKPAPAPVRVASGGGSRTHEDARSCLELANNTEISKCAEKYRQK
jgi:hypothetical protein